MPRHTLTELTECLVPRAWERVSVQTVTGMTRRVVADTGRLLAAFFVGAFASVASTVIAAGTRPSAPSSARAHARTHIRGAGTTSTPRVA